MDTDSVSGRVIAFWNDWQLRAMILLSLWLQIFLTVTGSRRKNTAGIWLGVVVWLAYSSADWLATISLGTLSRNQGSSNGTDTNATIPAFWAPILLVHLGGPDTITAYAVEDNELWSRHVLQLLTQLALSFYTSLRSWLGNDPLVYVAIPIIVSGIIKYGERVWILWLASSNNFRNSANKERKLLREQIDQRIASSELNNMEITSRRDQVLGLNNVTREAKHLQEAHFLFRTLKLLYGDYLVTFPTHMISYHILKTKNATEAFKLIAVELGYMYDVLFTKMMTGVFWQARFTLRGINFLFSVSALLTFWIMARNRSAYSRSDTTISYLLLGGAIVLEIYSVVWMLFSDWAMLWLSKQRKPLADSVYRYICSSRLLSSLLIHKKRWKESIDQHAIHKQMTPSMPMADFFSTEHHFRRWKVEVDIELKQLIFDHLLNKRIRYSPQDDQKKILAERGDQVLRSKGCLDKFDWSVVEIDFHESFLLWHVATCFCHKGHAESSEVLASISLANYMLYLRSDLPFMLPKEIGEAKYKSTSTEASLMGTEEGQFEGSVLSDGRKLASALDLLETEDGWTDGEKWEMITQVWVEMLTFAAVHCGWKEHTKALTRGGELLTFVAILMSHLGINEQCMYKFT
ncbi:unnamed protein product [Dovyalis caffra]|uniref:DUF4220 domain-containing protein n=1 Tax=Dovyalis caffra TaxID=77055 RepID=A0AAV1S1Y8_9ROSI|nr:unnamed protein product [Dovyalis caffra]